MSAGPLGGVRVLTLTQAWSGTFATELLGLLGAEVVQVEARRRPDTWRGGYGRAIPDAIADPDKRQRGWNLSSAYNSVNLNKRAITLDMSDPRGMELFKRLIPLADVVVDNFSPRVMGNWGLDFDSLLEIKPGIVQASLSAYGASGPYRNVPGIGGTIEPMSGMSSLLGYEGGRPQNSGAMYPDPVAGLYMASAILLALRHRDRSGDGQYIDLGMMEANSTFLGDALAEYSANGTIRPRLGNHHLRIAPHNIYEALDGTWIALSADDAGQWAALKSVVCLEALDALEFDDVDSRKQHEGELDRLLAGWAATQDAAVLEERLGAVGVPAARVRDRTEVLGDPQLTERGFTVEVTHPEAGTHPMAGLPWHFSRTPGAVTRHSPMLGEHSFEVLSEFLDVTEDEYQALVADNVSGDGPPE